MGLGGRQAAHSRPSDRRRERPTAERAATMSWYDEMVAVGRSKSLTTGIVRCGVAAVHEVLGKLALETPVNCHSELMEDSLRCAFTCLWQSQTNNKDGRRMPAY